MAPTEVSTVSRMTVVTSGSPEIVEQIIKQLNKLVDVIKLVDLFERPHIERELMLIKLHASEQEQREEFKRLSEIFSGTIVDITNENYTIELTGPRETLDDFVKAVGESSIMEVARSGSIGLLKGNKTLNI